MHWETLGTKVELTSGWYLTSESGDVEFEASQLPGNTGTYYGCAAATFEWSGNVLQFYASMHGDTFELPWWLLFDTGHVIPKADIPEAERKSQGDGNLLIRRITPDDVKPHYPVRFNTKSGTITFNENKSIVVSHT